MVKANIALALAIALAIGALALILPAAAQTTCPIAPGTLQQNLENRVVRTLEAGFAPFDYTSDDTTTVEISLEHAIAPAWTCATWTAELIVPSAELEVTGEAKLSSLSRTATASFDVKIIDMRREHQADPSASHMRLYERRVWRAVLVVEVFNGGDEALAGGGSDGQGRWHYPVRVVAHRE